MVQFPPEYPHRWFFTAILARIGTEKGESFQAVAAHQFRFFLLQDFQDFCFCFHRASSLARSPAASLYGLIIAKAADRQKDRNPLDSGSRTGGAELLGFETSGTMERLERLEQPSLIIKWSIVRLNAAELLTVVESNEIRVSARIGSTGTRRCGKIGFGPESGFYGLLILAGRNA
jgi:hypothetical protein